MLQEVVIVASLADLRAAQSAFDRLVDTEEPAELRVELRAGDYTGGVLSLVDDDEVGQVTVHLVGDAGAIWQGNRVAIDSWAIRVEGLRIHGVQRSLPLVTLRARATIALDALDLVGNSLRERPGDPLVSIVAAGGEVDLSWRHSWVVGNKVPEGSALVHLRGEQRGRFRQVLLDSVVWADNHDAIDLSAGFTHAVRVTNSLWSAPTALAYLPLDGASFHADGSALALGDVTQALRGLQGHAPAVVSFSDSTVAATTGAIPDAWVGLDGLQAATAWPDTKAAALAGERPQVSVLIAAIRAR